MTNYGWFLTVIIFGTLCWLSGSLAKEDDEPTEKTPPWKLVVVMWVYSLIFFGYGFAIRDECTILDNESVKTTVQQPQVTTAEEKQQ